MVSMWMRAVNRQLDGGRTFAGLQIRGLSFYMRAGDALGRGFSLRQSRQHRHYALLTTFSPGKLNLKKYSSVARSQDSASVPWKMYIVFGSQTGTAEDFSRSLFSECKSDSEVAEFFKGIYVVNAKDVTNPESLYSDTKSKSMVTYVMSCFGEGEPTDSARDMYGNLMSSNSKAFEGAPISLFGCGNSNYCDERYQAVIRHMDKKLQDLGANNICSVGEGDDHKDIEEMFELWKDNEFFPSLKSFVQSAKKQQSSEEAVLKGDSSDASSLLEVHGSSEKAEDAWPTPGKGNSLSYSADHPYLAKVNKHYLLYSFPFARSGVTREAYHTELDSGNNELNYTCGDHIGILPRNPPEIVENYIQRMGWDGDQIVSIQDEHMPGRYIAHKNRIRDILSWKLDITGHMKRSLLSKLAKLDSVSNSDKEYLSAVLTKTLFDEASLNPVLMFSDILDNAPSLKLDISQFANFCAPLSPRMYSISSSNMVHNNSVHITSAVVRGKTFYGKDFFGPASNYLKSLSPGDTGSPDSLHSCLCFIRPSMFHLPKDPSVPCIFIGAGTGIAPFRGFLQELHYRKTVEKKSISDRNVVFYGCHQEQVDFMYEDEFKFYANEGIAELVTAFSHDPPSTARNRIFVQTRMRERADEIWELLQNHNAHIFVCGAAETLAKGVHTFLSDLAREKTGEETTQCGKGYIQKLVDERRFLTDIFSTKFII